MKHEGGWFAKMRHACMLRRILDGREAGAEGAEKGAAETGTATAAGAGREAKRSARALDALIVEAVRRGGSSLPPSGREPLYRETLVAAVEKARSEPAVELDVSGALPARPFEEEPPGEESRRRRVLTLPRVAAACLVILALLVGMGFASTYAMPGNPLYSVKRAMERARFIVTPGGESHADLLLASAERRLDELEYAGEREMAAWYASLAMDAGGDILEALEESESLTDDKAAEIRSRASGLLGQLESLLLATLDGIPPEASEELQQETEEIREELWPEGIPPDWVDPWADGEDPERQEGTGDGDKPAEPVTPVPPVEPAPPVEPGEPSPPVELPRGRIFVFRS